MPALPRNVPVSSQGSLVRVAFFVEADGSVTGARVIGTPRAELAALCLEAVQTWQFEPATKNGTPVRVEVHQRFLFTRTRSLL